MQVASEKQAPTEVVLGICAVEVEVGRLQGPGWLRSGESAGFTESVEHCLTESLLADPGLAQSDAAAAGNPLFFADVCLPPRLAGHQILFQHGPQGGRV